MYKEKEKVARILPMSAKILTEVDYPAVINEMEFVTRVCYKSEDKKKENFEDAEKWVAKRLEQGHMTTAEFGQQILVKFDVPRALTHRKVRHRLFSFMQQSLTHYESTKGVNYLDYVDISCVNTKGYTKDINSVYMDQIASATRAYNKMRLYGADHQTASLVFPVASMSTLYLKGNIRLWREYFMARCSESAGTLTREVSIPLLNEFKKVMPVLFQDIYPSESKG